MRVLLRIGGVNVERHPDGRVTWIGEMTIDADGSPRAYGPTGTKPLDYLGNAGRPGNWWGVVTDSYGNPVKQGREDPYPGYFVSTTAYQRQEFKRTDPRRYLDSEKIPFIVVPGPLIYAVPEVVLGCKAEVIDRIGGRTVEALVGDIGPSKHLGEASIFVADSMGIRSDPKTGGSSDRSRWIYTIWPGVAARGFVLQPS